MLALALLVVAAYSFTWVFITIGLVSKQRAGGERDGHAAGRSRSRSSPPPTSRPTSLPGWMQPIADNQPFTIFSNALRSLTLGGADAVGLGHSTPTGWC